MAKRLDHLIWPVADLEKTVRFYTEVLGLELLAPRDPFTVVRISDDCVLQLAPWGTQGGGHLAFSMDASEFEEVQERIVESGIPYGDSFDQVGNMRGPGVAEGARGETISLYCNDPSGHLIEIISYKR